MWMQRTLSFGTQHLGDGVAVGIDPLRMGIDRHHPVAVELATAHEGPIEPCIW